MNKKTYIYYSVILILTLFFIYKYNTYFKLINYVSGNVSSELNVDTLKRNLNNKNNIIFLSNDVPVEVKSVELNSNYNTNKIEILDITNNNYHLSSDSESEKYCIISTDVSNILFGQSDTIGKKIEYNKEIYTVTSVMKDKSNLFIVNADKFSKLEQMILITDSVYNNKELEKTAADNNIDIKIHNNMLLAICINILIIIYLLLLLLKLFQAVKIKSKFFIGALSILIGVVLIVFIKNGYYPREYLPTKWSDFQFFYKLKENLLLDVKYLFMSKKPLITYELYESQYIQIVSIIILIIGISHVHICSKRKNNQYPKYLSLLIKDLG